MRLLLAVVLPLTLLIFNQAFAEDAGSLEISLEYTNGDRVDPSETKLIVYQDDGNTPYLEINSVSSNPFVINPLPLGHHYTVEANINGMYAGIANVDLTKSDTRKIGIPISGGIRFSVFYDDGYTPIKGATVSIKSTDGKEWRQDLTDNAGKTMRFWLQSTSKQDDHYIAEISISPNITYTYSPVKIFQGIQHDYKVVTKWPKILDYAITVSVYNENLKKVSKSDGSFVLRVYDSEKHLVAEDPVDPRGNAVLSNLNIGQFVIQAEKKSDNQIHVDEIWGSIKIILTGNEDSFSIFKNETLPISELNCQCVAFRLDDIQDFWLNDVQIAIMEVFQKKQIPLTVGIVGNQFGNDTKLTSFVTGLINQEKFEFEVANRGFGNVDFTQLPKDEQSLLLKKTNEKIYDVLKVKPAVFIPPLNKFNDETLMVLEENGMTHLSASILQGDKPPFDLKNAAIYQFPEVATTGYYDPDLGSFVGISSDKTYDDLKESLGKYGFAVVTLHLQEFSKFQDREYTNQVNSNQINELEKLIEKVQKEGIKIVLIRKINVDATTDKQIIPNWIKNNAGWWSAGQIGDNDFASGIEYMIKEGIIMVFASSGQTSEEAVIPDWIRNNAGWWSADQIGDKDFLAGIEYLVKSGIINVGH